ncbi:MAG: N-acyl homoserine lactonase family protein, partial [Pseudomonadota bacterium]
MGNWEVYALKYAERNARTRADSFIFDPRHDAPHDMDYYIWVIRNAEQIILVDTGYDAAEAKSRGRPIQITAPEALEPLGLNP